MSRLFFALAFKIAVLQYVGNAELQALGTAFAVAALITALTKCGVLRFKPIRITISPPSPESRGRRKRPE